MQLQRVGDAHIPTIKYIKNMLYPMETTTAELPYLPLAGGTMSGVINMGTNKITDVVDPDDDQDAATKKYVDDVSGEVPSDTVTDETTFGITPAEGTSLEYSRGDHTHGTPESPTIDVAITSPDRSFEVEYTNGTAKARIVIITFYYGMDSVPLG